ncbi:cytochrome c [Gluconobacter kanchanaburiensis]|uniref:Cytochrome c n=1 Tax=Gluconobacter kanchanaburiensis NBRC 103587 TaxID=1307948 RepID=A0A511B430_9PROT|nr:cytochrome c [Gluconobacter kanchanaburiensis]MBF0861562.1 cytochrome c [Gluconobacter kanchanaburiensis]GBR66979.1 sorbitol dehydrogenase cytochrome c subunit [Gluconobacter kanchanaburiensis NBRC 103587]GEK95198.1 cytochrome c [Gluconobacter kanchanaburiensis NBRC 103587]
MRKISTSCSTRVAICLVACSALASLLPKAQAADVTLAEKGRYIATAADCLACHTAPGGKPFAGGYPIITPVGTIYSTNITPAPKSGIGDYTKTEFFDAVRRGIGHNGKRLYPAMPYTSYAAITNDDMEALYAFFRSEVAPVEQENRPDNIRFPFSIRSGMALWNWLYLDTRTFQPRPGETSQVARGRYLVDHLEHCGTCHTPRTLFMGPANGRALSGSVVGAWYAPNITTDKIAGIADWTDSDLRNYLTSGHAMNKGQAAGPMAEVVTNSTRFLTPDDVDAMIAYLREVSPIASKEKRSRTSYGSTEPTEDIARGQTNPDDRGWKIFSGSCASCHQAQGQGINVYPSLTHNSATGSTNARNLVATILTGVERQTGENAVFMPAFGPGALWVNRLSDQDIADVSNFILKAFGNPSVQIDARYVEKRRAELTP